MALWASEIGTGDERAADVAPRNLKLAHADEDLV
jgi:hypothetical protein